MEERVHPGSWQMVTGERAWELKGGVAQVKDNMSLRACTRKQDNARSRNLCSKKRFLKEKLENDHTRELLFGGVSFCWSGK